MPFVNYIWRQPYVAVLVLAACSSASPGPDAATPYLEPTLVNLQEQIFDKACATAGCHTAEDAAGGLNLSSVDASYQGLLEVPARNAVAAQSGWLLVTPGEPNLSFLIRKMELPGLGEGQAMPIETKLNAFYLDVIRQWISDGAER